MEVKWVMLVAGLVLGVEVVTVHAEIKVVMLVVVVGIRVEWY